MFYTDSIEGMKELEKELPEELQFWHKFGTIISLHYDHIWSADFSEYINYIELVLTDAQNRYTVKLSLYRVIGLLSFDMLNGFFTGFTIEDCSDWGYERQCRFRISSLEQDIEFEIYCEEIKVKLQL